MAYGAILESSFILCEEQHRRAARPHLLFSHCRPMVVLSCAFLKQAPSPGLWCEVAHQHHNAAS